MLGVAASVIVIRQLQQLRSSSAAAVAAPGGVEQIGDYGRERKPYHQARRQFAEKLEHSRHPNS